MKREKEKSRQAVPEYDRDLKLIKSFDSHIGDLQCKRDDVVRDCMKRFHKTEDQIKYDMNRGERNGNKET